MHYSRMHIDELYGRAGEAKRMITFLENKGANKSVQEVEQLKNSRAILRQLKKEIKTRIVQTSFLEGF
jgi:hypothetical protein